jgi:hypothetical protein
MPIKKEGATTEEMIAFLKECLEPDFGHMMLNFSRTHLSDRHDGFILSYNSVPKGTRGVDVLNTFATPKFSFFTPKNITWNWGESTSKVKVEHFSGSMYLDKSGDFTRGKLQFRAKTGTPEQVLEYFVRFFLTNKEALLP